jgi:hypothetical protein
MEKGFTKFSVALIALLAASCAGGIHGMHGDQAAGVPTYAEDVNWHTLAEGKELARTQKKPMVVDYAVPKGCDRCDFLQDNVYSQKEIVDKINADFIPIWINLDQSSRQMTEEEKRLGEKYDYNKDCLLLFLDHEAKVITDPEGKKFCFAEEVEPEDFNSYLDHVRTMYVPAVK